MIDLRTQFKGSYSYVNYPLKRHEHLSIQRKSYWVLIMDPIMIWIGVTMLIKHVLSIN